MFYKMLLHISKLSKIFHTTMALKSDSKMSQNMLFWTIYVIHICLKFTKGNQTLWSYIWHSEALPYIQIFEKFPESHWSCSTKLKLLFLNKLIWAFIFQRLQINFIMHGFHVLFQVSLKQKSQVTKTAIDILYFQMLSIMFFISFKTNKVFATKWTCKSPSFMLA